MALALLHGAFPRLFNLSLLKNHFVSNFLVWTGSSCSFSFGFHHTLIDRETSGVMSLLSLLKNHSFCHKRRDVRVWNPSPLDRFSCKSSIQSSAKTSPWVSRFFPWYEELRSLERFASLPGTYFMIVSARWTRFQG